MVSVVLPFYNAPHLQIAIQSIVNQTFTDFELLLVNNGSTDDSLPLAKKFISKDRRIKLLHEPRKGVVFAANTGIKSAAGKLIMRMDADDYSFPRRIEQQVDALNRYDEIGVVSGMIAYHSLDSKGEGFKWYVDWVNSLRSVEEIRLNQFVEFPLVNPSLMFKRELFEKHGLFKNGDFPEDYEFFLRLQAAGVQMCKIDQLVLKWFDSKNRLTRTDAKYAYESFFKIKAYYLSSWLAQNNPFHPAVLVWGAGRVSRRRSEMLKKHGIEITGYIDVTDQPNTIHYEEIPHYKNSFIVSYVNNRGARDEIRAYLHSIGFREGERFILAS